MKPRHKQNFNEQNKVKPTEIVGYKNWKEKELASGKKNIEMRSENEWISIWNKELTRNERYRWMNDAKKEEKALLEQLSIEKPPQNAYHLWFKEKVPEFKKKDPHLTFGDLSKMMAEVWNNMNAAERKPFHEKLRVLRIIFEEKLTHHYEVTRVQDARLPPLRSAPVKPIPVRKPQAVRPQAKRNKEDSLMFPNIKVSKFPVDIRTIEPTIRQIKDVQWDFFPWLDVLKSIYS